MRSCSFRQLFFASCIYEHHQRSSDCKLISKNPIESFSSPIVVRPTGLEPAITTLKGWWLNQFAHGRIFERKTRLELATNSLEGCDSTIELLPQCVPVEGLEPPRLSAPVPKTGVSADSTTQAFMAEEVGFEPTQPCGRLISSQLQYHYAIPPSEPSIGFEPTTC